MNALCTRVSVPPFHRAGLLVAVCITALFSMTLFGCLKHNKVVEWNMEPSALEVYHYLVLQDAITQNDGDMVLESVAALRELTPDIQVFRDSADFFLLRRDFEKSRTLATEGLALYPNDTTLCQILTEAFIQERRLQEAAGVLREFIAINPDNYDAVQELGRIQIMLQEYQGAERTLSVVPENARTPMFRYLRAMALLGQDKIAEGERELSRVIAEDPSFSDAWVNLAMAAQGQGRHLKAAEIYRKALAVDDGNIMLWLRLVDAYLRAGENDRALAAAQEGPAMPVFRLEAVTLFLDLEDYRRAERLLEPFRTTPGAPDEAYFYLAAIETEYKKDSAKALHYLLQVTPQSRLYERSLLWRLEIMTDEGLGAEALQLARENIVLHPDSPSSYSTAATTAMRLHDQRLAIGFLREGLEKAPGHPALTYHLGSLLDLSGEKDEAMRLMEELVDRDPNNAQALNYVGYTLAEEGRDLDRAHALLQRAVLEAPDDPHIADSLAWVHFQMGNYQEAWRAIRRSIALGGTHAVIWEHYGDIALKVGEKSEARKGYKKALEMSPDNPETIREKLRTF